MAYEIRKDTGLNMQAVIMEYVAVFLLIAVPVLFVYLAFDATRHPK